MDTKDFTYSSYLKIDQITDLQSLASEAQGKKAHDEMLFIIIHQTYELWFKQILWEVDSIISILAQDFVPESELNLANHRLRRVLEIQRLLISQIDVLETMTALEFLEFRNMLFTSSGFQSAQFRLLENKMGLRSSDRAIMGGCPYHQFLDKNSSAKALEAESSATLFSSVEKWLERTPYVQVENYDFWKEYQNAVKSMFNSERLQLKKHIKNDTDLKTSLAKLDQEELNFKTLIDASTYENFKKENYWRFSHKALMAALFIQLYRHEPQLSGAFNLITSLIDMDEKWTMWRYRHAQMVQRMLGQKVGTGGSSGSEYLKSATEKHKVFNDFFKLSTFFIQSSHLPQLPLEIFK